MGDCAVLGLAIMVATSAAGGRGGFQVLFNANRDVLRSPNLVELGQDQLPLSGEWCAIVRASIQASFED